MKSKEENSDKKQAAREYVESQLNILKKHGTEVSLSSKREIIRKVARVSA
jgi:RNase P subunit RPR2